MPLASGTLSWDEWEQMGFPKKYFADTPWKNSGNPIIYTSIFGDYEPLTEPKVVTSGWEYVCFSDREQKSPTWKTIVMDRQENPKWDSRQNSARQSRLVKIIPELYFHGPTIWIDASMEILGNLDQFVEQVATASYNVLRHPERDCIYDEGKACVSLGKDSADIITPQLNLYKKEGFQPHSGLAALGVIVRQHSFEGFHRKWWTEIQNHSHRDQLSFPYVAWKEGLNHSKMDFKEVTTKWFKWNDKHE